MDKKIKKYEIISGHDEEELTKMVNDHISEGWQPYGSPYAIINRLGDLAVMQAVVKYD